MGEPFENETTKEPIAKEPNAPETEREELTEEEKKELLSVFSETNENKTRKSSGFRFTIKNQLILVGAILVIAGLLLGSYFLFFKEKEPVDPMFVPSEKAMEVLNALEDDVTIELCNMSKSELDPNENEILYQIYMYADQFADASRHVKLKLNPDEAYNQARVICNNKTVKIPYETFYKVREIDGKAYAFDAEQVLANAVLELTGKEKQEFDVRALDGFDEDGDDVLASGGVVMFPMVSKNNIGLINVKNENGEYTIYQEKGAFYFKDCELLQYNEELFASLIVDCRYVVTAGKLENQLDYTQYGLNDLNSLTASFSLMTNPDSQGNMYLHTVWIGSKSASGSYYYALYSGSKIDASGKTVDVFIKPRIYKLPCTNVETNLLLKKEEYFKADLVYGVESVNDCTNADNICLDYYFYDENKPDLSFVVRNFPVIKFSENAASNNTSDPSEVLKDKVGFKGTYTDWLSDEQKSYFIGLNSNDGKPFSITTSITNIASDGKYTVSFGLLKDLDNPTFKALLPDSVAIRYSCDGENYKKYTDATFDFASQKENTVANYSFTIESEQPVILVELTFTLPKTIGYMVMDGLSVFADGEDAQPNDALTGQWRMISPAQYIPAGKNFAYLDSTNFSEFLYGLCTLQGDKVERVGITTHDPEKLGDDTLNMEILAEYGLDKPAMHFAYDFNSFRTDLYVSSYDEANGCYYAYSTITGDAYGKGKTVVFCTGMVARLSPATASWLEWDPVEYIDHSLVGMFVYDIRNMKITTGGKTYDIKVEADGKELTSVLLNGEARDEQNFRYLYLSIVQLNLKAEYEHSEGEKPEEYLRIRIQSTSDVKEYVFYRVSSSKAYYTINGEGSYYCLVSALRNVISKAEQFEAGKDLTR